CRRGQAAAAGYPPASRQHRTRVVLAPPGPVGAAAGGDGPTADGPGMAAIHAGLHPIPAVARCASAKCPPDDGVVRSVTVSRRPLTFLRASKAERGALRKQLGG